MNFSLSIEWLLYTSAAASILSLIILAVKKLGKGLLGPKGQYCIWILLIIKLLLPFSIESNYSLYNLFPALGESAQTKEKDHMKEYTLQHIGLEKNNITQKTIISDKKNQYNYLKPIDISQQTAASSKNLTLVLIWALGAIVTLAYTLLKDIFFLRRVKNCKPYKNESLDKIIYECSVMVGLRKKVSPVLTGAVSYPAVYGVIRPKILLPEKAFDKLSRDELKYIVLHELSHIKRWDIITNCIITALKIVHWFNPVLWFAFRRIKYDMEVACDARVLSLITPGEYKSYGLTMIHLLRFNTRVPDVTAAAGMNSKKSKMKGRINMINLFKKDTYKWSFLAMSIIIALGITALTAPVSATIQAPGNSPMSKINFIDKNLAKCMALSLNKPAGSNINIKDAQKLTELKLYDVSSLKGIEYCENLEEIDLEKCKLREIDLLSKLPKLKKLTIASNVINPDLRTLGMLQNLEYLRLDNLMDFKEISCLKNLKSLSVVSMGDRITNLNDLRGCEKLECLQLESLSKSFNDLSALTGLKYLKYAAIDFNIMDGSSLKQLKIDLTPVKDLKGLKTLELRNRSDIADTGFVSQLSDLESLSLINFGIGDIAPLSRLNHLRSLSLTSCNIKDIGPVSKLKNLETLMLSGNDISDIRPLTELKNIKYLGLDNNKIQDLASVSGLSGLRELQLDSNSITDITPLKPLTSLKLLWLGFNNISDLRPLKEMRNLRNLLLNNNSISQLDSLSDINTLRVLWLQSNRINDITPLKNLAGLEELYLKGNEIKDFSPVSASCHNITHKDF